MFTRNLNTSKYKRQIKSFLSARSRRASRRNGTKLEPYQREREPKRRHFLSFLIIFLSVDKRRRFMHLILTFLGIPRVEHHIQAEI